jgi:DNA-binding MurR/RpiR family transcriptional regulator
LLHWRICIGRKLYAAGEVALIIQVGALLEVINRLKVLKVEPVLFTGDNINTANTIGRNEDMLLSQKIEHMVCYSQDSQKTVGEFLLKEKWNLPKYSMQEIADATYTSKSTLVRVAKQLGFHGWNDFIAEYKDELRYMASHKVGEDVNMPFSESDSTLEIAGKISSVMYESQQETLQLLEQHTLDNVVDALLDAKRICMFGLSINYFMAEIFQHKMILIGRPVEIISQAEQRFQAETMTKDDVAIMISYSGNDERRNPTSLIPGLEKNQVPIVGITSMGDNLLRRHSTYTLTIASRERLYSKIGSFATEASIMLILDTIYACYFEKNYDENMRYKISLSKNTERNRYSTTSGVMENK